MLTISADDALAYVKNNNPDFLTNRQSMLEAEQVVDKTTKSSRLEASLNMSIGFNQVAERLTDSYNNPLEQDVVSLRLNIPIVDWGVRKGRVNMAKNQLNVTKLSVQQDEISLEEEIIMTVSDFNVQQALINSAQEARILADMAFEATKQRYLIGKADISSLTLALNRQESAGRNYVSALQNFWMSYFKIRKLTLFDFIGNKPLIKDFESRYGIH
jgi:outer membrane protein TolC